MVRALDRGEGGIAEKVGALDGLGALHLAAASGKLPVCRYLVEEMGLDVKASNEEGAFSFSRRFCSYLPLHTGVARSSSICWVNAWLLVISPIISSSLQSSPFLLFHAFGLP